MGTIARFTFREAVRKRLLVAALFLTVVFLGLFTLIAHTGGPAASLFGGATTVLLGVYLGSPLPSLLAVLATAPTVSAEIESGAMHAVLARPITRAQLILGRFIGLGLMLVGYTLLLQGSVMVIAATAIGARVADPVAVLGLLCLQPLVLVAMTLLLSTLLPTLTGGAVAILLYGLGAIGGVIEQGGYIAGIHTMVVIGIISSLLVPADTLYRMAAGVVAHGIPGAALWEGLGPGSSMLSPSPAMLVYAGAYIVGMVALAAWAFSRRDL